MSRNAKLHPGNVEQTVRELWSGQPDFIEITTPATISTEFAVEHGLGRIPRGFLAVKGNNAASFAALYLLYGGATEWTKTHIYLESNAPSWTWTIAVF